MDKKKKRYGLYIGLFILFLFLCILISEGVGSASISIGDSLKLLLYKIPGLNRLIDVEEIKESYKIIIFKVRLPRILLSSLVGGALSVVGCTFQAIFKNDLADPHILGISSGAALGASIAIVLGITVNFLGIGITSVFAFIGAIFTIFLVYKIGNLGGRYMIANLLLTGTAIGTMLSSCISLLMIYNRDEIEKVYLWTLGSFSFASWSKVYFLGLISLIAVIILIVYARDLNVILTGDETASSLGIDTSSLKKILIIVCAVLVAASTSVSGPIGFVGLIIPHCMRLIVGSDHKYLLPFSYLAGASFMVICDTISRTIAQPTEIPVGIITAVFGAPYFIFLLYRNATTRRM